MLNCYGFTYIGTRLHRWIGDKGEFCTTGDPSRSHITLARLAESRCWRGRKGNVQSGGESWWRGREWTVIIKFITTVIISASLPHQDKVIQPRFPYWRASRNTEGVILGLTSNSHVLQGFFFMEERVEEGEREMYAMTKNSLVDINTAGNRMGCLGSGTSVKLRVLNARR